MGSSKARERYDDGACVVLVGVMPDQGAWESHGQGEGRQAADTKCGEGRKMRKSCTHSGASNWKAVVQ